MKLLKPIYYIPLIIILILIASNPSRSSFASYLHQIGYKNTGRDFNGLVFSIYSQTVNASESASNGYVKEFKHKNNYLGILGNFIKIGKHRKESGSFNF